MSNKVRTRFAPSPTGVLHIGSVRTALFCWLYAKHYSGEFILRIEDTDLARSTEENVDAIYDGLNWLGIGWDEEPIRQTHRFDRYREVAQRLLDDDKAYYCSCSRERLDELRAGQMQRGEKTRYDGHCRERGLTSEDNTVVRFRNPLHGEVVIKDLVRGTVTFQNSELDDLIIVRSDGSPTYNFTVVVDDSDMAISHVIRGDDHLNNTPRQVNLYEALGEAIPEFAHLPMILGPDGAKLSKRHGAVDVREYRTQGYLPQALINYLVRLGWSHGDQEVFTFDEMVELFDVTDVNQSASSFNPEKLRWLNQQHIIAAPSVVLGELIRPYLKLAGLDEQNGPSAELLAHEYRERAETLVELVDSARYCYEDFESIDAKAAKKHLRPVILEPLRKTIESFEQIQNWSKEAIHEVIENTAMAFEINLGKLGQPIRVAVTGGSVSPPIDATVFLVGQKRAVARLRDAMKIIEARAEANAS